MHKVYNNKKNSSYIIKLQYIYIFFNILVIIIDN